MRFVIKPDAHKNTLALSRQSSLDDLLDITVNMNKSIISGTIYREPYNNPSEKRSRVEDQLVRTYHNKCGYCERIAKADIEHYRPKGKVKGVVHNGYYWLCYEWTNLLPSCVKCNRDGGKHYKFPIAGQRLDSPILSPGPELNLSTHKATHSSLLDEKPMILHPEIDHPENYFEFAHEQNRNGIVLVGIDAEDRGKTTIEVCKLNRQELRIERLHIITEFKTAVNLIFKKRIDNVIDDDELLDKLLDAIAVMDAKSQEDILNHTLFRKYILKTSDNFEALVISCLETNQRDLMLAVYNSFYGT